VNTPLIGLGARRTQLNPLEYRITGESNTQLLKRMLGSMSRDADRISQKWAYRMATYARELAPSSARSRAAGKDTNNPHERELRDTVYARQLSSGRYIVGVEAPWAIYSLEGARRHRIAATATGMSHTRHAAAHRIHILDRRMDVLQGGGRLRGKSPGHAGLFPRYYDKRLKVGGKIIMIQEERKLSTREVKARAKRQARFNALSNEVDSLRSLHRMATDRMNTGSSNLIFPWSRGVSKWNGRLVSGLFVGPLVNHPGTKRNNFILKARARIGSPFAADIRRLLEGRYS
jgi:hypothetical protein